MLKIQLAASIIVGRNQAAPHFNHCSFPTYLRHYSPHNTDHLEYDKIKDKQANVVISYDLKINRLSINLCKNKGNEQKTQTKRS